MKGSRIILAALLMLIVVLGCKDKKKPEDAVSFQKGEMLTHFANQIILPNYQQFYAKVSELKTIWTAFQANPSDSLFLLLQRSWKENIVAFHKVKLYEFGPAANIGFRAAVGTFPADTTKIQNNIANGSSNLSSSANIDAIGLSAIEYLFFRTQAKEKLMEIATSQYLTDVINKLESEISAVYSTWNSSYASTFSNSTGTESTSGFSLLINEFNREYELAKNAKLGIPIGKQSLGVSRPEYIEAPYAEYSLTILKENLIGIHNLFQGNGVNGITNKGLDDYLIALGRTDLVDNINSKMQQILSRINALSPSLKAEMDNNPESLNALYVDMQNLVVHYKTDMTSAFGILITYQDNDGD